MAKKAPIIKVMRIAFVLIFDDIFVPPLKIKIKYLSIMLDFE